MVHPSLRSALRVALSGSLVLLAVACSSKASDESTEPLPSASNPPRGAEPAPPLGGGGAATPQPGANPGNPADPGAKPTDPGAQPADPADPGKPGEPTPNAGTKCVAGSVAEAEPNDAPEQANVVDQPGTFCGQLGVGDVDHMKFTLPAGATSISLGGATTQATYEMTVEVDGASMPLEGALPFKPGMEYVIKVTNTGQADLDYRLDVSFK
jgi:hypothetical protein